MNPSSSSSPMDAKFPQDLDWLAFCYVADELDPSDRESFERRLAEDQLAREAVANAVGKAMLIHAAVELPAAGDVHRVSVSMKSQSSFWTRPVTWASGAAALALLIGAVSFLPSSGQPSVESASSQDLAEIWVNTLVSLDQNELEELVSEDIIAVELDDEADSWMFAALAEMEADTDPDSLDPMAIPDDNGDLPCLE